MSNVYLDNNRIMKMKKVDKELKKIGNNTDVKIVVFSIALLLAGSVFVVWYMRNSKEQFKQELIRDLSKNPIKVDSVYNGTLSNQR